LTEQHRDCATYYHEDIEGSLDRTGSFA